jgi:hypothetical protein
MKYLKLYEEFNTELDIREIMKGYLTCAVWTEEERIKEDEEEEEISGKYSEDSELKDLEQRTELNIHNFSDNSVLKAYEDIKKFLEYAGDAVEDIDENQLGHDLWLTRNHHGAGFFDHGYDDDIEKVLMDSAHKLGEEYIYSYDGKLHFSSED